MPVEHVQHAAQSCTWKVTSHIPPNACRWETVLISEPGLNSVERKSTFFTVLIHAEFFRNMTDKLQKKTLLTVGNLTKRVVLF